MRLKRVLLVILALCMMPIAQAQQDAQDQAVMKLLRTWNEGLAAADELYGGMMWALDYVDAWAQSLAWDDLARAKAACVLVSQFLAEYSYPEISMTAEEELLLARRGFETAILGDFGVPAMTQADMAVYFRQQLLAPMENFANWRSDQQNVREIAGVMREYLQVECDYFSLATNYLLLPLYEQGGGSAVWTELQRYYPVVFSGNHAWTQDALALEERNAALYVDSDIEARFNGALQSAIARTENTLLDLQMGRMPDVALLSGQPDCLPLPEWYDAGTAQYAVFHDNGDGSLAFPRCGDDLTQMNLNLAVQQDQVSLSQLEAYLAEAQPYAQGVERSGNFWTLWMDGYSVAVSWENEAVQMIFWGQTSAFASEYVLDR